MSKSLKIILGIIALFLVLILLAVLYLFNMDPNSHKGWITARFQQETGRELELNGDIELSLYPWLGLQLSQVTVGNPEGFGPGPMLEIEAASARVKLLPLLSNRYEIDTLRLHGVQASLEIDESGRSNWDRKADESAGDEAGEGEPADPAAEDSGEDSGEDTGEAGQLELPDIVLGGVDIQRVNLSLDDRQTGQRFELTDFRFTSDELVYGQPIELDVAFNAAASQPEIQAEITLNGMVNYDLDSQQYDLSPLRLDGRLSGAAVSGSDIDESFRDLSLAGSLHLNLADDSLSIPDLEFSALGTQLGASVEGADVQSESASYRMALDLSGSDLAMIFRIAQIEPLASDLAMLDDRSFELKSSLEIENAGANVNVSELQASMLGASLEGNLVASGADTTSPLIRGTLNTSGPDLPMLIEVLGQFSADAELSQLGRDLGTMEQRSFSAQADFDANLQDNSIQVPLLQAQALGFTLDGQVSSDQSGAVDGRLQLRGDQLPALLGALGQTELAEVAQELSLELRLSGDTEELIADALALELVVAGSQIPDSPATLAFRGQGRIDMEQERLVMESWSLAGLGLEMNGDLDARGIFETPQFDGRLNVAEFNLRDFLAQLNQEVPEMADDQTLQRVALAMQFSGTENSFELRELEMVLDETTLSGDLEATSFEPPALDFSLAIDQLNADRYLPPDSDGGEAGGETGDSDELPVDILRDLRLNGQLMIDRLTLSGLNLEDSSLTLNASEGLISVSSISTRLYEGSLSGEMELDLRSDTPAATVAMDLQQVTLAPLLHDFMDASYLSGRGNVELALNTEGDSVSVLTGNLNGGGSIALEDGVLQGVDVGGVLLQVETMLRTRRVIDLQRGEQTPFESFSASLAVNNGVLSTDDLLIAAPGFQVAGRGTLLDLRSETMDFGLTATVDESTATQEQEEFDIGGYSLPIACSGSLASPRCLPDAGQIAREALSREAGRRVEDFLERTLRGGRDSDSGSANDQSGAPAEPAQGQQNAQPEEPEQEEEPDPTEELINRTLDRIFR